MVGRTLDWNDELERWLKPFVDRLGHKARRRMCPLYVSSRLQSRASNRNLKSRSSCHDTLLSEIRIWRPGWSGRRRMYGPISPARPATGGPFSDVSGNIHALPSAHARRPRLPELFPNVIDLGLQLLLERRHRIRRPEMPRNVHQHQAPAAAAKQRGSDASGAMGVQEILLPTLLHHVRNQK